MSPQRGFICPDNQTTTFQDCLKQCRMHERCVSKPTLKILAKQRKWTGIPSTTMLLSGTRYSFLKLFRDYYEDIQKLAWVLLGNKVHKSLEDNDVEGNSEIVFKDKTQTGIADYYDEESCILWDYKASGSFKVHKALGLVSKKIIDPSGARYKRNGQGFKKGDIKKITVWDVDESQADKWEWVLQTNRYALWLEDDNRPVNQIKIEIIVRDGGLKAASTYGVDRNIAVIDVPMLKRNYVLDYFNKKASMLRTSIAVGWAPRCNDKECWNGRKCKGYCPISHFCDEMPEEHPFKERFNSMAPAILC